MSKPARGLFITGTGTGVGKTYVASIIVRELVAAGHRVGVYKPAESGCLREGGELAAADARILWEAAEQPGELAHVCPQRFEAPLAPHLAARAEGRTLDDELLRSGIDYWNRSSDVIVVEGAGGLMSPLGDEQYVADLAWDLGFPLVVVARNGLGTIHETLATLIVAATFREGLDVVGVVLCQTASATDDSSPGTNRVELEARSVPPVLAEVAYGATQFDKPINWYSLARISEREESDYE